MMLADLERRWLPRPAEVAALLATLASRLVLVSYGEGASWVRTTYYDTDDLALLRSAGGQVRARVREYAIAPPGAPPRLTGVVSLEVKHSTGVNRLKWRAVAPAQAIAGLLRCGDWAHALDPAGLTLGWLRGRRLAPRMATAYRRQSFTSHDGVRLTLDEDLRFGRPQPLGAAGEIVGPPARARNGPPHVLEMKCRAPSPEWASLALAGLSGRWLGSKYQAGMEALR